MDSSITQIKESYKVLGMTCAACASSIESYLSSTHGIEEVVVNYPNQSVSIQYDSNQWSIEQIQKLVKNIGYELVLGKAYEVQEKFKELEEVRLNKLKQKLIISVIFSLPIFLMAMFFMGVVPYENSIMLVLSLPVLFWSGSEFYTIAWKKIKQGKTNMDTLVALSTGIAFLFSVFNTVYPSYFLSRGVTPHVYFESAVIIITLILLGRFLEEKAKGKTSSAIKNLMGLKPKVVTAIRNGEEVQISYHEIVKGDLIVLKPGDKVPVDGKVKKGHSFIDESMISGEPIPVEKVKKSLVFAGTINQKGSLRILATKVGEETLLSQIIRLVEEAQASKPAIQKLVDKIAGIFVPIVIGLALFSFIIWMILGPQPAFSHALLTFITVLIIACPCALGLATPTALMVGLGKGAELGILIKDAQVLETAYKIDTLVLDKTGTITEGKPKVTDVIWFKSDSKKELEEAVLSIEIQSEHPVADAIVEYFKALDIDSKSMEFFKSYTGLGASGLLNDKTYYIGNQVLMEKNGICIPKEVYNKAQLLKQDAKTVVFIGEDQMVIGLIAVADQIKASSIEAIQKIQDLGITIHMLTGDNAETAKVIANQAGITHFQGEVLPHEKGNFVKQLQEEGKIVAMAGDGINDSHALAQANIGIAMGSGTDIAMENAGITLMHSNLNQIAKAIQLSKATMKAIKQNLFWAFIYNLITIPVAAGILYPYNGFLLNPMVAGGAMSMSSISVLLNSLRLKRKNI